MFGYNHDYDSDDYDLGYDEFEYGYGMNGYSDDSGDEMAFHMQMMGMLDDSYDSQILPNSDYFNWEETRMKDSHLLRFRALVPGVGLREEPRITSMGGGEWGKITEMEKGRGWLESKAVVGYQDLYNLASKVGIMLTAWRVRMKQCQGDWSKDQITELLKIRKVTRNQALSEIHEYNEEDNDTDLGWWLRQFLGTHEVDLSVEDRMRYSVGRGMMVFGTGESLNQLAREVNGVKILAQNFVMVALAENLPVPLPFPALLSLAKITLTSGGSTKLGWSSNERATKLVESRYINRLYLAMLDIYNVIREVMFKHAAETASPSFPNKFKYFRSTLARNFSLLQSFQQLLKHEEPQAENIFYRELKELNCKLEPSRQTEIVLQNRDARNRVVVSGDHVFTVHAVKKSGTSMTDRLKICVHHLETGEIIKEFIAVPLALSSGNKYTFSTPVCVEGDFMVISLSQGYQCKISSVTSSDMVFVINWVQEKLVMSKKIPHSLQVIAAVRQIREEYGEDARHFGDDDDSLNSSFYDDDMVNSSLGVFLTEKNGCVFLLHSEVVLPELEYKAEVDKWGQHVRIWGVQDDRMVQELHDVRILDLQAGLIIYQEVNDGRFNHEKQGCFTQFYDNDVIVKWLDLESGKEIFQENYTKQTPRPVFRIASLVQGDTLVVQHQPGHDTLHLFKVGEEGSISGIEQVVFPALTSVGCKGAELKINLIEKSLVSFSHSVISPSLDSSLPVNLTRCVLARAGEAEVLGEIFVPSALDYDEEAKTSGYYMVAPADRIIQGDSRLVILRGGSIMDHGLTVHVQQYEFQKPALEVIKWDEEVAEEIVKKVEAAKKAKRLVGNTATVTSLDVLAKEGRRVRGSLVNWCGSFGFLKLDAHPDASNVFIHISEIGQPRPFLTAGIRLEVRLEKDLVKEKVRAVAGRVMYY